MSAFNRRLEPKEIAGMPIAGAVGLVMALIFISIILITPGIFKIIPGLLMIISLVVAAFAFRFRAQLPFLFVIFQGRFVEPGRVTTETRTLK